MANVLTYHNDNARTGEDLGEGILTPQNVTSATFGKLFNFAVDGKVDAQPLYVAAVTVSGHRHNLLIVATEHDSVYAIDADTGTQYWRVSVVGSGETPSDARNCDQVVPEIGITATPVIDPTAGAHGIIYVVAMSKDTAGNYHQRLHALDLTTGAEQLGGPITVQASVSGSGNSTVFDPKQYKDRPGLLLLNGTVYTSWGSHCDVEPYAGWSIAYSEKTLAQTAVFNFVPNGSEAAPWNAGGAPGADLQGNIYYSLGNGTFDPTLTTAGFPSLGDYGNSLVKLSTGGGGLSVADYWTMYNTTNESGGDIDLGSGGMVLLPDMKDSSGTTRQLLAAAGKDSNLYVADRNNMGKYDKNSNATLYQELPGVIPNGAWSNPAYFNNTVYFGPNGGAMRAFSITNALLSSQPTSVTPDSFVYPGANPSISAYGTSNAIVWAMANNSSAGLYAYNAGNLGDKYYDSTQAPNNRDQFGTGNKFMVPTVANGKVYAGTTNSVAAFGLLHTTAAPIADGVYTLTNQKSQLVLDDPGLSTASGKQMIQWTLNHGINQGWFFSFQGNGYYTIQNTSSGLYLTDTSGGGAGTPLEQQARTYDDSQLWSLVSSGSNYSIQNKETGLVVDDTNNSTVRGTGMILWTLKPIAQRANQTWAIQ
ncbi:MAG TPA: RICIN domain-containing protein [Acidobacteriaceae bacterium]